MSTRVYPGVFGLGGDGFSGLVVQWGWGRIDRRVNPAAHLAAGLVYPLTSFFNPSSENSGDWQ
jgi:hypothetical protein